MNSVIKPNERRSKGKEVSVPFVVYELKHLIPTVLIQEQRITYDQSFIRVTIMSIIAYIFAGDITSTPVMEMHLSELINKGEALVPG
jgi:ABC-type taurine transport system substrate-binding protein